MKNLKPTLSKTVAVFLVIAVGVATFSAISASAQTPTTTTTTTTSTTTTTTTTPSNSACDPDEHHWPAFVVGEGGTSVSDLSSLLNSQYSDGHVNRFSYFIWEGFAWHWRSGILPTTDRLSEGAIVTARCADRASEATLASLNLFHGHMQASLHTRINVVVAPETVTRQSGDRSSFLFSELLSDCGENPSLTGPPTHSGIVALQIRNLETTRWSYSNLCYPTIESQVVNSDDYDAVTTIHQGDIIYVIYDGNTDNGFPENFNIFWNSEANEFQKLVEEPEDTGDDGASNDDPSDPPSEDPPNSDTQSS